MVMACQNGKLENVKWLIEQGVEPDSKSLISAVDHDHLELVQYLIADGVKRDRFSEQDISKAFVWAATKHTKPPNYHLNLQIIEFLLKKGANRNYRKGVRPFIHTAGHEVKYRRIHACS